MRDRRPSLGRRRSARWPIGLPLSFDRSPVRAQGGHTAAFGACSEADIVSAGCDAFSGERVDHPCESVHSHDC